MNYPNEILDAYLRAISYPVRKNADLRHYCSFRIGGKADYAAWPDSVDSLCELIGFLQGIRIPYTLVGNGTNLLFDDAGYRGVAVFTSHLKQVEISADGLLAAECGAPLNSMALCACRAGLTGMEFAYGIPGTCGGAVAMNAGAYGGEIKDILRSARLLNRKTGNVRTVAAEELGLSYRHSILQNGEDILLSAVFALQKGDQTQIKDTMDELMKRRHDRQPLDLPSAGSAFKRPEGYYAGQLIEEAGLKGKRIGDAAVSEKHAGFIVNLGNATSHDVLELIRHIQDVIGARYHVQLECEIRYVEP